MPGDDINSMVARILRGSFSPGINPKQQNAFIKSLIPLNHGGPINIEISCIMTFSSRELKTSPIVAVEKGFVADLSQGLAVAGVL